MLDPDAHSAATKPEIELGGTRQWHFESECAGGEVQVAIDLSVTMGADSLAHVAGKARLYEGSECQTGDEAEVVDINITVPPGSRVPWSYKLTNKDENADDYGDVRLFFTNNYKARSGPKGAAAMAQ